MAWNEPRDNKNFDLGFSPEDLANVDGVYRAAFPSYRVFIYGHEVTEDTLDVRVNQAGGSAERIPSGCSFTLANKDSQYMISHADMLSISKARGMAPGDIDTQIKETRIDSIQNYSKLYEDIDNFLYNADPEGAYEILKSLGWFDEDVAGKIRALVAPTSSDPFSATIDNVPGTYDREKLDALITEAIEKRKIKIEGVTSITWDDSYLIYNSEVKREVIQSKMGYKTESVPLWGPTFASGEREIFFDYPMQEGMCIFHQNDPVRVAFRDPFDPRMWYWMFAGFVDATTENSGVNRDSTITITCTDVSKMARYSTLQSQRLMDPNIVDRFGDGTAADIGITFYNQVFAGLTIFEILETLFFGAKSTLAELTPRTMADINAMDEERLAVLLYNMRVTLSPEEAADIFGQGVQEIQVGENNDTVYRLQNIDSARQKLFSLQQNQKKQQLQKFKDIGVIRSPRGVAFKRKSKEAGLHVYFKGEMDATDKVIGSNVVDLWHWNEIIHHRVRKDDLYNMYARQDDPSSATADPAYNGEIDERDFPYDPSMMEIKDVIKAIGTDLERFPVGAGNVFLLMPATVETKLSRGILDNTIGGVSSMQSKFKDRLSLLYDLANRIDFRCYATPKGDFVFEMPFYDFNVEHFLNERQLTSLGDQHLDRTINTKWRIDNYTNLFKQVYSGDYSPDDIQEMTKLRFETEELQGVDTLFTYSAEPYFDYAQQFVIEEHEQFGYSDTSTDQGIYTLCLSQRNPIANQEGISVELARQQGDVRRLIPMLGIRVLEEDTWGFTDTDEQAHYYCNLTLNRVNAEQRNLGVDILPAFGLMVNRPIFWMKKMYQASIVSMQHSIVWNSSCDTSVNVNQIRGWDGDRDKNTGLPIFKHLAGKRPFDLADVLDMGKSTNVSKKGD